MVAPDNVNTDELVLSIEGYEILHANIVSSLRVRDGSISGGGFQR